MARALGAKPVEPHIGTFGIGCDARRERPFAGIGLPVDEIGVIAGPVEAGAVAKIMLPGRAEPLHQFPGLIGAIDHARFRIRVAPAPALERDPLRTRAAARALAGASG